jgi:AmmeMemoRadiSam system protein A
MTNALRPDERRLLLEAARAAITARLSGRRFVAATAPPALLERRGAFVTLHERHTGALRGCIGYIEPLLPLIETVARAAQAAAVHDDRFEPVSAAELAGLEIEISVLGLPAPIGAEDVVIGTHGLILALGSRRGLLLPQVPVEHRWDRDTYLDQLCRKAGLPPGTWRQPESALLGFTAEVFGEAEGALGS